MRPDGMINKSKFVAAGRFLIHDKEQPHGRGGGRKPVCSACGRIIVEVVCDMSGQKEYNAILSYVKLSAGSFRSNA